jgi:hypothetical protein
VDERQLAELFRDAADGGPAAGFGHADVVAASHRATARRRMATAGGSALGIIVLVGGIVLGSGYFRGTEGGSDNATSGGSAQEAAQPPSVLGDQRERSSQAAPGGLSAPSASADTDVPDGTGEQGPASSGKVVPWPGLRDDDARAGCGPVDRELADALVSEFPATSGSDLATTGEFFPVPDGCPPDARAAALPVDGGALYVVLAPVRGDGPTEQFVGRPDGAIGFSAYTPKGQVLVVLSVPETAGGEAPYAPAVMPVATALAERY